MQPIQNLSITIPWRVALSRRSRPLREHLLWLCLLLLPVLTACVSASPAASDPLPADDGALAAHQHLRLDCQRDSDCAVMDIGNCCGHYPACVHVDSQPDPAAVVAECSARGLAGICGYPVIEGCVCRAERCQPTPGSNEPGPVR